MANGEIQTVSHLPFEIALRKACVTVCEVEEEERTGEGLSWRWILF
jgi:hypothetical protein